MAYYVLPIVSDEINAFFASIHRCRSTLAFIAEVYRAVSIVPEAMARPRSGRPLAVDAFARIVMPQAIAPYARWPRTS